jgi:NAD(P)-dependent dehydrogenase (short-subunit alcohol dehydrogenase family)
MTDTGSNVTSATSATSAGTQQFAGKVAVVTGGGSGIGLGIAHRLAAGGAAVALIGRDPEKLARASASITEQHSGARVTTRSLDVRDHDAVDDAFTSIAAELGGLHLLVNNAAGNFVVPAEEMSPRGFKAVVDIVLNGTFFCSRAFARIVKEGDAGGSILNVIATYAWTGHPGVAHSAAAKAGVQALTRTLAVEWARYGIRVNCIAPGPTETEGAGAALWPTEEDRRSLTSSVPLKRFTTPEEVAVSAAFLLSDDAAYVTGDTLVVDGGQWLGKQVYGFSEARSW